MEDNLQEAIKKFAETCKQTAEDNPMTNEKLTEGYNLMIGIIAIMMKQEQKMRHDIEILSDIVSVLVDKDFVSRGEEPPRLPTMN